MKSGLLLAGNLLALMITIGAFLQLLAWPIAGLLILASLIVTILLYGKSKNQETIPSASSIASPAQQKIREKPPTHARVPSPEPSLQPKPAKTKSTSPKVAPPPPKQARQVYKPGEGPTVIEKGDFLSFPVELEAGKEMEAEVAAGGNVNVYILTEENLTSLDLGQEFWYEEGSEETKKATLQFTAPEDGRWFLVVENADVKDVSATITIRQTNRPHPRDDTMLHADLTSRTRVEPGKLS